MENIPTNPLNTGNGVPPATTPTPISTTPTTPAATVPVSPLEKIMAMKKYIIAGVAVIALLVTAYVAYSYVTGIGDAIDEVKDEASTLNNSLKATTDAAATQSDADKEKLNNVVNELKDQYKEPAAPSNPPGMIINLDPDATETPAAPSDSTDSTDSGGVAR